MRCSLLILNILALVAGPCAFGQALPVAELTATSTCCNYFPELGYSVAISGSTIAAAAPGAFINGLRQGAVYVYAKSATAPWASTTQSAILLSGGVDSVGISGDGSVIVAAGINVTIFVRPSIGWHGMIQPVATLHPGPQLETVAINAKGDTIVAGAYNAGTPSAPQKGEACVWVEPSGGWANANGMRQTATLTAFDGAAYDQFGWSVTIFANTIVIGAPGETGLTAINGAAYVYARPQSGSWRTTSHYASKLTASDGMPNDGFGFSVSIGNGGSLIGVGAPASGGSGPGRAYVFAKTPKGGWPHAMTQSAELTPTDETRGEFGWGLAVAGNVVLVGAPYSGGTYTFAEPVTGWADISLPKSMIANVPTGYFGLSNSIGGKSIAVGAPGTPVSGDEVGAIFIFTN